MPHLLTLHCKTKKNVKISSFSWKVLKVYSASSYKTDFSDIKDTKVLIENFCSPLNPTISKNAK